MFQSAVIDSSPQSETRRKAINKPLPFITFTLSSCIIFCIMYVFSSLIGGQTILNNSLINVIYGAMTCHATSSILMHILGKFPGSRPLSYLIPTVAISMLVIIASINLFRLEYSRPAIAMAFIAVLFITFIEFKFLQSRQKGHYAVVPFGFFEPLLACNQDKFTLLVTPALGNREFSGVIIDNTADIPENWQPFIAEELAKGTPILNAISAYESITGKSPLDHYGEITYGELKPAPLYLILKRLIETTLIILSTPLTLPIVLLTAITIKLESKGPAFFTQKRIGKGGKVFSMYKLRSMYLESEANGAQFADEDDPRITRTGKIIRKSRIDELPQFLNILKGDMALIGPRPEQAGFVKEFEKAIPLYNYRHVVRPGITGWAQVTHGYASCEDSTREKLAHDFYYVKNLSLWLDFDITYKTIRTMLTGFGAR
mgnify:CR=1 FL=1